MAWSVTIDGETYTEAQFSKYGYATRQAQMMQSLANVAAGIAAAAGIGATILGNVAISVNDAKLTISDTANYASGVGGILDLNFKNASGTIRTGARAETQATTGTNGAEVADFVVSTMRAGTLTEALRVTGAGELVLGTSGPTGSSRFRSVSTSTATSGVGYGASIEYTAAPAATSTAIYYGFSSFLTHGTAQNLTGAQVIAANIGATHTGAGAVLQVLGAYNYTQLTGAGAVTTTYAMQGEIAISSSGNATTAIGVSGALSVSNSSGTPLSVGYGLRGRVRLTGAATISSAWGLEVGLTNNAGGTISYGGGLVVVTPVGASSGSASAFPSLFGIDILDQKPSGSVASTLANPPRALRIQSQTASGAYAIEQLGSGLNAFAGQTTISNATPSTTSANGALAVTGGVGIGGALNVGGNVVASSGSGLFGVGATSGGARIRTVTTVTGTSGTYFGVLFEMSVAPAATSTSSQYAIRNDITHATAQDLSGAGIYGDYTTITHSGSGTVGLIMARYNRIDLTGAGAVTVAYASNNDVIVSASGNSPYAVGTFGGVVITSTSGSPVTSAIGTRHRVRLAGAATIPYASALEGYVVNDVTGGTITDTYVLSVMQPVGPSSGTVTWTRIFGINIADMKPSGAGTSTLTNAPRALRIADQTASGAYAIEQLGTDDLIAFAGQMVCGGATGGAKGAGTINAKAVYDDDVILTDYVFDKFLGIEKQYSPRVAALHGGLDPAMFKVENYAAHWRKTQALYGMPSLDDCIDGIVKEHSLGAMNQKLWQTAELHAIHIGSLHDDVEDLKRENAALKAKVASLEATLH